VENLAIAKFFLLALTNLLGVKLSHLPKKPCFVESSCYNETIKRTGKEYYES